MITELKDTVQINVRQALQEDIGSGDITAHLIPPGQQASARIICREQAVICGRPWFDEVFRQIDPAIRPEWLVKEGEQVRPGQTLVRLQGTARHLLTGERCAMNFLQTLSGTATRSHYFASLVADSSVKILDTRKTLPGLRLAQKYSVRTGGCHNHRIGLYDAFLIKENHIAACGGIREAVSKARQTAPGKIIEIEVETIDEFLAAKAAGADTIMLDNFSIDLLKETVQLNKNTGTSRPLLEASGGISETTLPLIAATGVDCISIGALTKDCKAVDLSMRLIETEQ